jgi:hypothetical protein
MTSEVRGRARGVRLTVRLAVERTRPKKALQGAETRCYPERGLKR